MWITEVYLWSIAMAVIGGGIVALAIWLRSRNIETRWYDWLIGAIGLVILLFTIQNFYTSFTEVEPLAAWMFILLPGLPALVLIGIATMQVWRRNRKPA